MFITPEQSYKEGYQKACDDILNILKDRPITCKEEIRFLVGSLHHINKNPNDNRIENLLLKEK